MLFVNFVGVGKVPIERQTWFKVDRNGKVIGQRSQFPLVPCYASTCHKTQGLTLKAAVAHCSREVVPGLIYVAATRVEEQKHLQVLQFKNKHMLPPPAEVFSLCIVEDIEAPNNQCCRNKNCQIICSTAKMLVAQRVRC